MNNRIRGDRIDRPESGPLLAVLVGAAVCVAGYSAHGQGAEPAAAKADFASAFERFFSLGLPDAVGAKPVTTSYSQRDHPPAWLMEESDGEAIILIDQVTATTCRNEDGGEEEDGNPAVLTGITWKPAKIEDFLKGATSTLERHKTAMRKGDFYYNPNEDAYGTYLLFAAHLHRRGMRDEANALATLLFESSKIPESPVTLALGEIADSRYAKLADSFFADGNWSRFADGIDALATDFGTRWALAPGGRLLAEKLRARATTIAPPAVDAPELDAIDQSLLAELNALEPGTRLPSDLFTDAEGNATLWILHPPEPDAENPSVFTRILARGLDSLPLLVALLGDEFLLPVRSSADADIGMEYEARRMFFSGDDWEGEPSLPADAAYARLARPLTRGEIATQLLSPLLGGEAREVRDPAQLRTLLKSWLAAHGKKQPLDLARHYLDAGDDAQIEAAVGILIDQGEESDVAAIEKHLLTYDPETEHLFEKYAAVTGYLRKRGAAGKDFLAKYEDQSRKAYHEQQGGGLFQKMSNNSELKRYFAPLHELVNPRTFADVLDEALSGDASMREIAPVIMAKLGEMEDPQEKEAALETLLKAVVANPDKPKVALAVLGWLGDGFRGTAMQGQPLVFSHAAHWQAILEINASAPGAFGRQSLTTAEYAAYVMESLYGEIDDFRNLAGLYQVDWVRANANALERARARIDGKATADLAVLPNLGDTESVDPAGVWKRLADTEASDRRALLASLEFTELAALHRHLARKRTDDDGAEPADTQPVPDPAILAEIAREANRLASVDLPTDLEEPLAILRAAENKALDKPLLEALIEALRAHASAGGEEIVAVTFRRGDTSSGTAVAVTRHKASEIDEGERDYLTRWQGSLDEDADARSALVAAYFGSRSGQGQALWECEPPGDPEAPEKPEGTPEPADTDDDDALEIDGTERRNKSRQEAGREAFWKACDALLDGTDNPLAYAAISFWSVPADAIAAEPDSSDAEP